MVLLAGGGVHAISALGNCVVPRCAVRLHLIRRSGLRGLSLPVPRYWLRIAAPYHGRRPSSPRQFVCRAAAAAAVESGANVRTALPTIPSEATLAKVCFYNFYRIGGCGILHA